MLKKWSVRKKLMACVITMFLLIFVGTILFVNHQTRSITEKEVRDKMEHMAAEYALEAQDQLNQAMDVARSIANLIEGMKNGGEVLPRETLFSVLRQYLEEYPHLLLGTWVALEKEKMNFLLIR